jgi:hypothetical protein
MAALEETDMLSDEEELLLSASDAEFRGEPEKEEVILALLLTLILPDVLQVAACGELEEERDLVDRALSEDRNEFDPLSDGELETERDNTGV